MVKTLNIYIYLTNIYTSNAVCHRYTAKIITTNIFVFWRPYMKSITVEQCFSNFTNAFKTQLPWSLGRKSII